MKSKDEESKHPGQLLRKASDEQVPDTTSKIQDENETGGEKQRMLELKEIKQNMWK